MVEAKNLVTEMPRCKLVIGPLNSAKGTRASRFKKANTALPTRQQGPIFHFLFTLPLYPQQLPHHWLGKTCSQQAQADFRQEGGRGRGADRSTESLVQ